MTSAGAAGMASRIVVFPVMGRRWAFTAVLPTPGTGDAVTGVGAGASASTAAHGTPTMSVRELLRTFRDTSGTANRAELLTDYASDKMSNQYNAWDAAPDGSIRKRVHSIGQRMLSRLGPTECLLKSIPKDASLVEIVYPNCSVNPRLVRRRVRHLAISAEVVHRRYMYGSVALLPFSAILGILPLPNVVLAWNLFRAYSHWRALQGGRKLHGLVTESAGEESPSLSQSQPEHVPDTSTSDELQHSSGERPPKADQPDHWVFLPSESLDSLLGASNVPTEAISDVTLAEICKEYALDPQEVAKWRDHKLPIKSFG